MNIPKKMSKNISEKRLVHFNACNLYKPKLSPARKGLTSRLSFVVSNFEVGTFPLVSWVRCGA